MKLDRVGYCQYLSLHGMMSCFYTTDMSHHQPVEYTGYIPQPRVPLIVQHLCNEDFAYTTSLSFAKKYITI